MKQMSIGPFHSSKASDFETINFERDLRTEVGLKAERLNLSIWTNLTSLFQKLEESKACFQVSKQK